MIRFTLRCSKNHTFEAWFPSNAGYEDQKARGLLSCAVCGDPSVEKAPMAPRIMRSEMATPARSATVTIDNDTGAVADSDTGAVAAASTPPARTTDRPSPEALRRSIEALHRVIEARFENVGKDFAREARDIHDGVKNAREIYGQATLEEVKDLAEDGIPVMPIPSLRSSDA